MSKPEKKPYEYEGHRIYNQALEDIAQEFGVSALITTKKLCDEKTCATYMNGEFLYRDSNHIRRNLKKQTLVKLDEAIGIGLWLDSLFTK